MGELIMKSKKHWYEFRSAGVFSGIYYGKQYMTESKARIYAKVYLLNFKLIFED